MNHRMLDPVVADLNRHLGEIARDERRDEAIERRTAALMTIDGGYAPHDAANFAEALGELVADARYAVRLAAILDRVGKALADPTGETGGHYEMIGLHLVKFLKDYWTKYARNQAETEVAESCPRCFGRGCRHCEAPENDERH